MLVPTAGGHYVEAYVGQPNALNPLLADSDPADRELLPLLYAGLTRRSPDGQPVPDLAERWDVSPDGRTYTFTLRPNLRWAHGRPLEAADVAFTFDALRAADFPGDPDYLAPWREARTEALDARTVRVSLARPWAGLLEAAALGIVPREHLEGTRGREWLDHPFNLAPIGAGPYRVVDLTTQELTLAPNPWYHGPRPYLAEVGFRFYPTVELAARAVLAGEADGVAARGAGQLAALGTAPDVVLHQRPDYARPVMLWLNTSAAPFDERAVRAAAALAVDRESLARGGEAPPGTRPSGTISPLAPAGPPTSRVAARATAPGERPAPSTTPAGTATVVSANAATAVATAALGEPARGPLPPTSWAYAADTPFPSYAPARAAALLDSAGWRTAAGGERARASAPLSVTLSTNDEPERRRAAEAVARDLRAVGFRVEVAVRPWSELARDAMALRRYQALLLGHWMPTLDPDGLRELWRSDTAANLARWHNPRADELLAQGASAVSLEERRAAYAAFQALWAEETPSVPLYYPYLTWAVRQPLQAVDLAPIADASDRLTILPRWYVDTIRVFRGW